MNETIGWTVFGVSTVFFAAVLGWMATRKFGTLGLIIAIMLSPIIPLAAGWNLPDIVWIVYSGMYCGSALVLYSIDWRHWSDPN